MAAGYFTERRRPRPRRARQGQGPRLVSDGGPGAPPTAVALPAHARGDPRARRRDAGRAASPASSRHFAIDLARLDADRRSRGRGHPRALSRTCASRCTAAGATSTPAASTASPTLERALGGARRRRARAGADRPGGDQRAARRRRRAATGATRGRRPAQASRRSEGLAVASFRLFAAGLFSVRAARRPCGPTPRRSWRVDGRRLARRVPGPRTIRWSGWRAAALAAPARQRAARSRPSSSARARRARATSLDALRARARRRRPRGRRRPAAVLDGLGPIWPGRLTLDGVNLGDIWPHPAAGGAGPAAGLVPFHKLSQWLTYSLLEPLERRRAARHRPRRAHRPGRVPQRRPVPRHRRARAAPRGRRAARRTRSATRSSSSGGR